MSPSVTICMAAYNGEATIQQQVISINSQQYVNFHINVSLDYSVDKTEQLLDQLSSSGKFLQIISKNKKFGSAAQNFFYLLTNVDFNNCDFIALSDQDDIWLPSKLSRAVSQLSLHHADAYSSNVTAFWPSGKQKLIHKAQPQQAFDFMFESAGPGCTFVLTKKLALDIQAFLIDHQEHCKSVALHDWFIYAFARSKGFTWHIDQESHMLYRQHDHNVVGANVGFKAKWQRFKKLRTGWLSSQALVIANILGYTDALPMQKIKRLSLFDRVWLILNASKLRRRFRDQLAIVFLMMIFKKP